MNFRDRKVTDEDGNEFIFTVEMQRRLSKAGLPPEPQYLSDLDQGASAPPPRQPRPRQEEAPPPRQQASQGDELQGPISIQIDPMTGKYIGQIKWYNSRKGYGFILRGGGEEIFFHRSNTSADPDLFVDGQWILYDVEETNKGPEATDVEAYEGDLNN